MSLKFEPDGSLLNASWAVVLLSERDVAGQIPINFVTTSAVSLKAACFGNDLFERTAAGHCISNLLAVGYRRFVIDLYWSSELREWLLCPATIPQDVNVETVSADISGTPTATAEVAQGTVTAEIDPVSGWLLYRLGPYRCSDGLYLSDVMDVFLDYFHDTSSRINVYTRFISFNLHAAASATDPDQPAPTVAGTQLPTGSESISSQFRGQLGQYIYTPSRLLQERLNLNESWYEVDDDYKPIVEYFTVDEDSAGIQSTPDGWPSTKYLQLAAEKRLLLEYGSVDSQIQSYNISDDSDVVFSPDYLTSTVPVSAADEGGLDSGCLYVSNTTEMTKVNASWAISNNIPVPAGLDQAQSLQYMTSMVVNLTGCGITSTLNTTLFDGTADTAPYPYRNLSLSSTWAWAVGEPQAPNVDNDPDDLQRYRCAVMDLTQMGHWRAANCGDVRRAACRVQNHPFKWELSPVANSYADSSPKSCPENTSFSVPRTGLENTYLYRYLLAQSNDVIDPSSSDPLKREIWVDLNSLDIATCWVSGGSDAGCPYGSDPQQLERRTVVVAAIAGIVILIIAALTLFVKCNANRRSSRRNKRVAQGWEYEGVPS